MSYKVNENEGSRAAPKFVEYSTMLEAMKANRVFEAGPTGAGLISVEECCDGNFALHVTPDQLRALARELMDMADRVAPPLTKPG